MIAPREAVERLKVSAGARTADETTEEAAAENVRGLFETIAPSYDLLNHLMSFGLDRRWWRRSAERFRGVLARPEAQVVDLCCGTGDMTAALLRLRPANAAPVVGLDFSAQMLGRARVKYAAANALWVEGDAMRLPFADASVDLVTAAFGFRNLTNYAAGLKEIHRVLRPGGELGILECNHPEGLSGWGYRVYLHQVLPRMGGWISGEPEAYRYLPESIARFSRPQQMLPMLAEAGFVEASWTGYLLRAAGLYRAVKA